MPIVNIGYHGTTDSSAKKIIEQQHFIPSTKDTEWLGEGVYFFAYKFHARVWANNEVAKPKNAGKTAAVLSAHLTYEEDQLLDLDDPEQLQQVNELFRTVAEKTSVLKNAPKFDLHGKALKKRWCLLCNTYRRINKRIAITAYTFQRGKVQNSFPNTQRQFCVNKSEIISEIQDIHKEA